MREFRIEIRRTLSFPGLCVLCVLCGKELSCGLRIQAALENCVDS
jgi:hypothetical protein